MTRRNLQAELDAQADHWIAENDPDADIAWPSVDAGRVRGAVSLSLVEVAADLAAIRAGPLDLPRPIRPEGPLCSHCGLASVKVKRTTRRGQTVENVCGRCAEHFRRHAELPSRKLNLRQRRRMGLTTEFPLRAEVMAQSNISKAEKRARQLWDLAGIREATVKVCAAFAEQCDAQYGYLTAAESIQWAELVNLVRSTDAMIDLVRPEATRSLALDRYVQSRKAPPAPDLVGLLEGVLAMVELQRPQTPGALQVALDALALADRAKNTKSAARRDKAADALRSARQELQQAMKVPAPQEHLNWSTARLERMDQQLELAISSLEKGPA